MKLSPEVEQYRRDHPLLGSAPPGSDYGYFEIPYKSTTLRVMAAGANDEIIAWDHVSVSLENRCPNWGEMCFVKDLFFDPEETVIQFHPPKSKHINIHPHCLHLWRHKDGHALPPMFAV